MTPQANNRILIVDDNPTVHEDFRRILLTSSACRAPAATFELASAFQGKEALEKVMEAVRVGQPFAVAFVDVLMPPGWDGIETIERLWQVDPALQVVVCTAHLDYSWPALAARLGVNENLVIFKKPFDDIEVLQLAHALSRKWQLSQQAQMRLDSLDKIVAERTAELRSSNAELRLSEERFAKAFCASPVPLAIQTFVGQRFVDVNDAFLALTGFSRGELIGRTPIELRLCIDYEERIRRLLTEDQSVRDVDAQISTRAGELRQTLISMERLTLADEPHTLMMVQDISERLLLENQLRQAQKMEAVGQLAAGVAHDFNNMLTIIQGHASLQLAATGLTQDTVESLEQITLAADRAANLTRQLLAFSRRQIMRPRVLQLNDLLRDLTSMLRRLISEHIQLSCQFFPDLPLVCADHTGLEQVLMNLTLNARDAMPRGGKITITTGLANLSGKSAGEYVVLSVTDTGTGMDEATRSRIFEPFFTTKAVNKGTGMGLATVYGIVSQHSGWIDVETALDKGSTFRVFLPVTDRVPEDAALEPFAYDFNVSQHTVLIVEDDDSVRSMVRDVLEHNSYRVLEAENAIVASELWAANREEIELLLTDMVMSEGASGLELATALLEEKPTLKVIYTSGYSAELFESDVKLCEGENYLPKPYFAAKLISILRRALEPVPEPVA